MPPPLTFERIFYIGETPTLKQRRKRMNWREEYTAEEMALDVAEDVCFDVAESLVGIDYEQDRCIAVGNILWCATITAEEMAIYLQDV